MGKVDMQVKTFLKQHQCREQKGTRQSKGPDSDRDGDGGVPSEGVCAETGMLR